MTRRARRTHAAAFKGKVALAAIDSPHDRNPIQSVAAESQQFCLPHQRQIMDPVDHHFALSRPVLPSRSLSAASMAA
jgi:hypothetical protein